jgi:hypothetical protein
MKKDKIPKDYDAAAVALLEAAARAGLGEFLKFSYPPFWEKMDFTKECEFLDAEMPHYMPKAYLEKKNSFTLFVRGTLKTGKKTRFLVNTVWMGDAKYAVGVSEVPDNVVNGFYTSMPQRGDN